jgi:hypothetical protein
VQDTDIPSPAIEDAGTGGGREDRGTSGNLGLELEDNAAWDEEVTEDDETLDPISSHPWSHARSIGEISTENHSKRDKVYCESHLVISF